MEYIQIFFIYLLLCGVVTPIGIYIIKKNEK